MKAIRILCPCCQGVSDLFLKSSPYMMVLNCPFCQHSLLHCENKTYEIEDIKIISTGKQEAMSFMDKFKLNQITSFKSANACQSHSMPVPGQKGKVLHVLHQTGEPIRNVPISIDDVCNLKIDLELSQDVSDFINKL